MKWSHNGLARDLAGHLRNNSAVIAWEDMQLGPSGSVRPDVYVIPKSFANFRPMAYECKISVSDFRSDVTSGKWQRYLDFACGVVFAVPAGLINKNDLPPGAGLIVRHENVWRTVKKPTLSVLDNLPRDAWIKMLMDGTEREAERCKMKLRQTYLSSYQVEEKLRKSRGDELARLVALAVRSKEAIQTEIEHAKRQAERIRKDSRDQQDRAHKDAIRMRAAIDSDLLRLGATLGLSQDATMHDLQDALRTAIHRLTADEEVKRLRDRLQSVIRVATQAVEPLPGEAA